MSLQAPVVDFVSATREHETANASMEIMCVWYSWTLALRECKTAGSFLWNARLLKHELLGCMAWMRMPLHLSWCWRWRWFALQFLRIKNAWTWTWTLGRVAQWLWPCTRHFQGATSEWHFEWAGWVPRSSAH
jgi:hypothetical protein